MKKRPVLLKGGTEKLKTPCGSLYATLNSEENKIEIEEVFFNLGKGGGCVKGWTEALGRVISISVQNGVDPMLFAETLGGINCHQSNEDVPSCISVIAKCLEKHCAKQKDIEKEKEKK